jgi:hypothetical protein
MKKSVLILLIALWCLPIHAQTEGFWRRVNQDMSSSKIDKMGKGNPKQELLFQLNEDGLKQALSLIQYSKKIAVSKSLYQT